MQNSRHNISDGTKNDMKIVGTFTASDMSERSEPENPESEIRSLVKRAISGRKGDFERLVKIFEGQVYRLAYRFFNNSEDACDAVQEVFLKVYRSLGSFEGRSSFKTWLYRITVNTCISICDSRRRERKSMLGAIIDWFSRKPVENPAALVLENEYQQELRDAVKRKIAALPETYRMPVILKDIEGMSHDQISEILGLEEGTVKSRIHRGRRILQESLQAFLSKEKD